MDNRPYDLEQVANQIGTAVLKLEDGGVIKSTGELSSDDGVKVLITLHQMVMDTGALIDADPLQRISVMYSSFQYVITVSESKVYVIKKPADC
mmetsp:Transcript_9239/g.14511  ORF Transcript_9239/g.14511 Transcript_9239/m.14511 type:complete len:93 (+) Transcript_9239:130-408(+)